MNSTDMEYSSKQLIYIIMIEAKNLTEEQIDYAWSLTETIKDGEDVNLYHMDTLCARIKRDEYGKISEFGWCVGYVLSPDKLKQCATTNIDKPFLGCNIRVFHVRNFAYNSDNEPGIYGMYITMEDGYNEIHTTPQKTWLSKAGLEVLQTTYGISEEDLHNLFSGCIRELQ